MNPEVENEEIRHHTRVPELLRQFVGNFFLWLVFTEFVTEFADEDKEEVEDAFPEHGMSLRTQINELLSSKKTSCIVISVKNHAGHPDSLILKKALEKQFPQLRGRIVIVGDRKTWDTRANRFLAGLTMGDVYLFRRQKNEQDGSDKLDYTYIRAFSRKLIDDIAATNSVVALYSKGTRDPNAQERNLGVIIAGIAQKEDMDGNVIVVSLENNEKVLPKVPPDQEKKQAWVVLKERLKNFFAPPKHTVKVVIEGVIRGTVYPQNGASTVNRKSLKEMNAEWEALLHPSSTTESQQ